jgi:hypothetical protein
MSYSLRAQGGAPWIFSGAHAVLVLRGRNAGRIVKTAEALRAAGEADRLDVFLRGVVEGATYATLVRIGDAIAAPPRIKSEGEAAVKEEPGDDPAVR